MKKTFALLCVLLASALLFVACGDDDPAEECTSLCEEAVSKGCNDFDLGQGSCSADCELANSIAESGGCQDQRDAKIKCEADQSDICDPGCESEDQAFFGCGIAYCQSNTDDPDCAKLTAAISGG